MFRSPEETSGFFGLADHDSWTPEDDGAAMVGRVAHSSRHEISDQNGLRSHCDRVGRADTCAHVRRTRRRLASDQHSWTTRRQNWTADVGDRRDARCDHRANVHITYSCGGRHNYILLVRFGFIAQIFVRIWNHRTRRVWWDSLEPGPEQMSGCCRSRSRRPRRC